jgi:hypothetical protein
MRPDELSDDGADERDAGDARAVGLDRLYIENPAKLGDLRLRRFFSMLHERLPVSDLRGCVQVVRAALDDGSLSERSLRARFAW